ncbi:MAG: undecaprenyl-diphosphate phosphatase [Candidatus Dormibacteraeota bacterium]|uniref:Undecaprenyl-diphosphatase n=1 Tax=Candidatus Aeolococcus gillhamiae TaxID=3127015 RepID=A0A934JVG8_9BACT|nr:undecaprenyl-diphosphate phosphatase [Candidatus Dormibacteraeota bacterium]
MSTGLVIFLAALQGATELFPVSSLGHAVVVPALFNLGVDPAAKSFVPFLALLHLGTGGALLILYREQWWRIIRGFVAAAVRGRIETTDERLAYHLVVGTIPAGVIGFLLETPLKSLFAHPRTAAIFLIVNGVILAAAEVLRRRDERRRGGRDRAGREQRFGTVEELSYLRAGLVGVFQAGALLPGISRSGVTMAGGLVAGLRHTEAVRFAFLLATPVILAAGLLEVPQLGGSGAPLGLYTVGAVVAGVIAYASARLLVRYFEIGRLDPFAGYCAALGVVGLIILR